MGIDLADYQTKAAEAIKAFWGTREAARQKQFKSGKTDQGERAGVTAGKSMDGFLSLVEEIVRRNGLENAERMLKAAGTYASWLLSANQVMGHACIKPEAAGSGCRIQEPSGAIVRKQLQQPD